MKTKKKSSLLLKVIGIIVGFFAANAAGLLALGGISYKKMKNNECGNNMMHSVNLKKAGVEIKPDTDNAYINCVSGCVDIILKELPTHYDMNIVLGAIGAVVNVYVPEDVKVVTEGTGHFETIHNMCSQDQDDLLPTVHIVRNHTVLTKLTIKEI